MTISQLTIRKILLPLDVDRPSAVALNHARLLSRRFDAPVVAVYVLDPRFAISADDAQKKLWQIVAGDDNSMPITTLVESGDPKEILRGMADRHAADLTVIGPQAAVGSMTEPLLATTRLVWSSARAPAFRSLDVENVICGVDFTPHDVAAIEWSVAAARTFGARLTLAHVTPSAALFGPGGSLDAPELKRALVESATARLRSLVAAAPAQTQSMIGSGERIDEVMNALIAELASPLLVIGRRPSAGILGGQCAQITAYSNVPVLSVPT